MTAKSDATAIVTTQNAKNLSTAAGANVENLRAHLLVKLNDAAIAVKQIIALTPPADANLSALNAILAELL